MRFIVAILTGSEWQQYEATNDYRAAEATFDRLAAEAPEGDAVAVFTKANWLGERRRYRLYRRLTDDKRPLPSGLAMWVINQADSGYF